MPLLNQIPGRPVVKVYRRGQKGDSAYEVAVKHGYEGTESEWNDSVNENREIVEEKAQQVADALEEVQELSGNILTLVGTTASTIIMGIGGNVTVEELPGRYPAVRITFLEP